METRITKNNNIKILKISGRIQMTDTDAFEGNIKQLHTKSESQVVIDLSDAMYLCSTALGVLIAAKRRMMRKGGELILVVNKGDILDVLRLTMIDKLIHLEDSLDKAIKSLKKS